MEPEFNTIQELEQYFYGNGINDIMKDAPVLSSTTGVYNAVYGKLIWSQLNHEANMFGVIPKTPWKISGWRLMTAKAGTDETGGVGEDGSIPATVKPTFAEVSNSIKTIVHSFNNSEVQEFLASSGDDAAASMDDLREIMGIRHKEQMNIMLLADVSADAAAATANYAGTNNLESVDRVISSDSEEDAFGGTYTTYFDIFGLDRDSATTYDSYVDHNSGTDRALTDTIIKSAIWGVKQNGGNTTVIVTGYDTYQDSIALYSDQVRYNVVGESTVSIGVNGIQTEKGIDFGVRLASIYQIPAIISKDVTQDGASRMYFLDTSDPEGNGEPRLQLSIAKPTRYFEAGMNKGDPFPLAKFENKGLFETMGEIKCTNLPAQGKVRDLS